MRGVRWTAVVLSWGLLVAAAVASPTGKEVAISGVSPVPAKNEVSVQLKSPDFDENSLRKRENWSLVVFFKDGGQAFLRGTGSGWRVTRIGMDGQPEAGSCGQDLPAGELQVKSSTFVILALPDGFLQPGGSAPATAVLVSFDNARALGNVPQNTPAPPPSSLLGSASGKGQSDIYLNGSYSPAIHSQPQYSIDAAARLVLPFSNEVLSPWHRWHWGGLAKVSTDNRRVVDPDSFLVSGVLQWIARDQRFFYQRAEGVLLNWNFAGLEFDRKTTNESFISQAAFEVPLRVYPALKQDAKLAVGLTPFAGAEFGDNLTNAVLRGGSGAILRGVGGGSLVATYQPKLKGLSKISVSSNYILRQPAFDEVFTRTRLVAGTAVDMPTMSSQARHHVANALSFTLAEPFSLTIKHEYGDVPPAFRFIDHKTSVGLTIMLRQNNSGRAALEQQVY
jgi:hypothetical protein